MRHESLYACFMRLSYQRQTEGYPPPAMDDGSEDTDDENERGDYEYDRNDD